MADGLLDVRSGLHRRVRTTCRSETGAFNGTGDRQGLAPEANDNDVSPLNSDEVSSWRTRHGC